MYKLFCSGRGEKTDAMLLRQVKGRFYGKVGNMGQVYFPREEGTTSGAMCLTGPPQLYPCSHLMVAMLGYHAMVLLSLGLDITRLVEGCGD